MSVRCGRRLPQVHLIELTDVVELARPDPDSEDPDSEDCPGCADCLRYCRECVEAAVDWVTRTDRRG